MKKYDFIYFIGAGGIGMSALVRYFIAQKVTVGGYDRTQTPLTESLEKEGATIHYTDDVDLIPACFKNAEQTLVVITPAIPKNHNELNFFLKGGFTVVKRAELLGYITNSSRGICLAGTHGKTTTSSMTAHLLNQSHIGCNAFLGGILKNQDSNLILSSSSNLTVIEADEFDRSFHHLSPYMAAITSSDPDHLDIYGDETTYLESFNHFTSLIRPGGTLIIKTGLKVQPRLQEGVTLYTYSGEEPADFYASNIRIAHGTILFDFIHPEGSIKDIELGVPVRINIENGVIAMAMGLLNGMTEQELKDGMKSYAGVKRRFEFHVKTDHHVYIDDYAHHPEEIAASIKSVKALYPNRKLTVIFQPHLFSRTQDFMREFAESLSLADEIILLDIYPARELPIAGVNSYGIFELIKIKNKAICSKELLLDIVKNLNFESVLTIGAGDIDQLVNPIARTLTTRWVTS